MANDLKILITANLNIDKSIGEINTAIKGLQKKVDSLKLNISMDESVIKSLNGLSKAMEFNKDIAKELNKVLKEEKKIVKEVDGSIKEYITQHLKSGAVITKEIERINKKTKALKDESDAISRTITEAEKYGNLQKRIQRENAKGEVTSSQERYKNGFADTTYNLNKKGELTSTKVTENFDQQAKSSQKLKEQMVKDQESVRLALNKVFDQGKVNEKFFNNFNKVIDSAKNISEIKKVEDALKRVDSHANNKALQDKLVGDSTKLLRTHSNTADTQGVNNLIASLNLIKPNAQNASNQLQKLQNQLKGFKNDAQEAARSSMSFGEMLSTAMTKFPVWMISATMFYAPIRMLESMTERLILIDTQMTDIRRVMDAPEFRFNQLLEDAVSTSDELASKLTDVLHIVGEFARMGDYSNSQLIDMASTAQVMQNISDLDAQSSVDTLTSAMLNFNIAAEDSVQISDKLNEVDL